MRVPYRILFCLVLLAGGSASGLHAQPEPQPVPRPDTGPIRFDRLSIDDGLMQRSVGAIVQDRQGFMWFGTQDGIDKYDGYTFTPYKHDPDDPQSLRPGYVRVLYEDADGILWIGIRGGLNRFDPATETFTHYLHVPEDTTSLSHNHVRALYEDRSGVLWVGTGGGGLN